MTTLILNRFKVPNNSMRYHEWSPTNELLVMIADRSSLPTDEAERLAFRSQYLKLEAVEDYESSSVESLAHYLHDEFGFDRVIALSEFDLLRAARLREAWGLRGQTVQQALLFRDKLLMKNQLEAAGIRLAPYAPVDNPTDLLLAADKLGYPLVLKPRFGAASQGIQVFANLAAVKSYLAHHNMNPGDIPALLLAEAFVSDAMFHIDGIISEGRTALCWPSEQTASCLEITRGSTQISTLLAPEDLRLRDLQAMTDGAIRALGIEDNAIFHAEIFDSGQSLVFNEVGCRVGGSKIREEIRLGFGVDLIEWYVRAHLGAPWPGELPSVPIAQSGFVLIPTRRGRLTHLPELSPRAGATSFEVLYGVGDELPAPSTSTTTLAYIVAAGETRESVLRTLEDSAAEVLANMRVTPLEQGGADR